MGRHAPRSRLAPWRTDRSADALELEAKAREPRNDVGILEAKAVVDHLPQAPAIRTRLYEVKNTGSSTSPRRG
jgi:hypothetical protein